MTSNAEIAKAMAENMTHAAVPLYGKKLRLPDRGAIIGIIKEFRRLLFPAYFIDHGTGIVIGETTVIGSHVKLYQGVTLGALSPRAGHASLPGKRHPTVCDYVTIYSGASILGGETVIGEHSVVGGNAFLTGSVADNTRVVITAPETVFKNAE